MKQIRLIYALLLAVALPFMTACSSDDTLSENSTTPKDGKVSVHLRISQAASATTRATATDENAEDKEMMNLWTVVVTSAEGEVLDILSCMPTEGGRERDEIENNIVEFTDGTTYNFYSFANIGAEKLEELLGFANGTVPVPTASDVIVHAQNLNNVKFPNDKRQDVDAIPVSVYGNNFAAFTDTGDGNKLGSYGIPMSNKQTIEIESTTRDIELIVVRMMAKIELQVYNDKGSDITIESVTLTDITKNADNNLKLFPKYKTATSANTYEFVHGDIQPNLNGTPDTAKVEISVNKTIPATGHTYAGGVDKAEKITFYINESKTPTNTPIDFGHFFLKIKLTGEQEVRYALIDDKGKTAADNGMWNYIARNDYRIIPIVLDDYKLDMIPYDFPAIGVYPASVKEEDGLYTINFHDYGHFHLLPVVTKYSTTPTTYVDFTSTKPTAPYENTTWGLVNDTFTDSWKSWTDASKQAPYDNSTGKFYRNQNDTKDGDEAGGEPIWYANTSSPMWQPNTTIGYRPFIFGYIADPGNELEEDKKVYHEFTINLYKSGTSAARLMTYRLYMILDKEQMLYSRSLGAPAARHTHGH